jgi:hypothetical protein
MLNERLFREYSFRYRKTKMLCPNAHGVKPALSITEDGLAVLQCGCHRPQSLPIPPGRISVEQMDSTPDGSTRKAVRELFPVVSPHTEWELRLAV